jgi:hypothetical protein
LIFDKIDLLSRKLGHAPLLTKIGVIIIGGLRGNGFVMLDERVLIIRERKCERDLKICDLRDRSFACWKTITLFGLQSG